MRSSTLPALTALLDPECRLDADQRLSDQTFDADTVFSITASAVFLRSSPNSGPVSQLLYGEPFGLVGRSDGWAQGISLLDGYRGCVPAAALGAPWQAPTHRLVARQSHLYAAPDLKTIPLTSLECGSLLRRSGPVDGGFMAVAGGWVYAAHLGAIEPPADKDLLAAARHYLGAPYSWGGRAASGLDCSGLIQQSFAACGRRVHRDSDLQAGSIGEPIGTDARRAGDLAFFPGHVGIMTDTDTLLHANAFHMAVTIDPLNDVVERVVKDLISRDRPVPDPLVRFRRPPAAVAV